MKSINDIIAESMDIKVSNQDAKQAYKQASDAAKKFGEGLKEAKFKMQQMDANNVIVIAQSPQTQMLVEVFFNGMLLDPPSICVIYYWGSTNNFIGSQMYPAENVENALDDIKSNCDEENRDALVKKLAIK